MFQSVFLDILFILSIAGLWVILLYHTFLAFVAYDFFLRSRKRIERCLSQMERYPFVSVLVPCHNEEVVIADTMNALLEFDYPKDRIEVIIIDDQSTDSTGRIIDEFASRFKRIVPLHIPQGEGGKGKSHALNRALKTAKGEIIAVYDADNSPEPTAIKYLVAELISNPKLAAACGKVRTINRKKNLLTAFINLEFISHQWTIQAGRWYLHGVALIPGTNFVIWRHVLDKAGTWDEKALTEDTELALRVLEMGYLISFNPLAITWEQEPESWKVWYRQRLRWLKGNQYIVGKYFSWLFKSWQSFRVIGYMMGIYVALLGAVIISDILFLGGLVGLVSVRISGPMFLSWVLAFLLFIITIYITLTFEESSENNLKNLWNIVLMYFIYSQCWVALGIRSFYFPFERKKGKPFWAKTERVKLKST